MDRINVSIRFRPLNQREGNSFESWTINDDDSVIQTSSNSDGCKINLGPAYVYDHVFGPSCSTEEIFKTSVSEIISSALDGVNGTIFAYGQTSSGKTFTMHGGDTQPGVILMAMNQIFDAIKGTPNREFLLRISYLEIYNEVIKDLLDPTKVSLKIHETVDRQIFVGNLTEDLVMSVDDVMNAISKGESNRHVGETNMNEHSSRSHTIFRMVIESREISVSNQQGGKGQGRTSMSGGAVKVSTLNLVDLAGSERVGHTGSEGIRLREGSHINKSLLALGSVIAKLAEGNECHIPYRDSKLTRILQPSLGGNARTAIICTATLSSSFVEETLSTLKFASRAKRIRNKPEVNEVVSDEALLRRYKNEINTLKKQLEQNAGNSSHENAHHENFKKQLEETEAEKLELVAKLEKLKTFILNSQLPSKKSRSLRRQTWFPGVSYQDEVETESPIASPSKKHKIGEIPEINDSMTRRLQSLQVESKDLKTKISLLEDEKRDYCRTLKATSLQCQKVAEDSKLMGKGFRNSLLEILVIIKDLKEAVAGEGKALNDKIDFLEFETKSFTVAYNDLIREKDSLDSVWSEKYKSLEVTLSDLSLKCNTLESQISSERQDAKKLQEEYSNHVTESKEIWEKYYVLEYDWKKCVKSIDAALEKYNLISDHAQIPKKLSQLLDTMESKSCTEETEKVIEELIIEKETLTNKLSEKDSQISVLQKQILELECNSQKSEDSLKLKDELYSMQQAIAKSDLETSRLQNTLSEMEKECSQLKDSLAVVTRESEAVKQDFDKSTNLLNTSEASKTKIAEELREVQTLLKLKEEVYTANQREISLLNAQVLESRDRVTALEAELRSKSKLLDEKINVDSKETDRLEQLVLALESEASSRNNELENLVSRIKLAEDKINNEKTDFHLRENEYRQEIEAKTAEINSLKSGMEDLKCDLSQSKIAMEKLTLESGNLRKELEDKLEILSNQNESLQMLSKLQLENSNLRKEVKRIEEESEKTKTEFDQALENFAIKEEMLNLDITQWSSKHESLQGAFNSRGQKIDHFKNQVSDLESRIKELSENLSLKDQQLDVSHNDIQRLKLDLGLKGEYLNDSMKSLEAAKAKVVELEKGFQRDGHKVLELEMELTVSKKSLAEHEKSQTEYEQKISELGEKADLLERDKAALLSKIGVGEKMLSDGKEYVAKLKQEIKNLQEKGKVLEEKEVLIRELRETVNALTNQVSSREQMITNQKSEISTLKEVVAKGEAIQTSMEDENSQLHLKLDSLTSKLSDYESEMSKLSSQCNQLKQESRKTELVLRQKNDKIKQFNDKMANLMKNQSLELSYQQLYENEREAHEKSVESHEKNVKALKDELEERVSALENSILEEKSSKSRTISEIRKSHEERLKEFRKKVESLENEVSYWKSMKRTNIVVDDDDIGVGVADEHKDAVYDDNKENDKGESVTLTELANSHRRRIRQLKPSKPAAGSGNSSTANQSRKSGSGDLNFTANQLEQCNQQ